MIWWLSTQKKIDKPIHFKVALEYCSTHRLFDTLKELVDKCKKSKNKNILEWAEVYGILHDWKTGKINEDEMRNIIEELSIKDRDIILLCQFVKTYIHYKHYDNKNLTQACDSLEKKMSGIENIYIKTSFCGRMNQMLSHVFLHVYNDAPKARERAKSLINSGIGDSFTGFAYNIIALSYTYTSNQKMNYYANFALSFLNSAYGSKVSQSVKNRFDKINALYTGRFDNLTKDEDDPLDKLIEGIVNCNLDSLLRSLTMVRDCGDKFFFNLIEKELSKFGISSKTALSILNVS